MENVCAVVVGVDVLLWCCCSAVAVVVGVIGFNAFAENDQQPMVQRIFAVGK